MPRTKGPTRPKIEMFKDEAEALRYVAEFCDTRELSTEANAATDLLRKAYARYFDQRVKDEPTWNERLVLYREAPDGGDPPPPLVLSRRSQEWGMIFNVGEWTNDDILWAAEHGVLDVNLAALRAQGESSERERLLKAGRRGGRQVFEFSEGGE